MKTKLLSFAVASLMVAGTALAETKTTTTTTTSESFGSQPKTTSSRTTHSYKSTAKPEKTTTVTTESNTEPASRGPSGAYGTGGTASGAAMMGGTTYGTYDYAEKESLRTENFAFAPQVGTVVYTDATGETDSRASVGLGLNWNWLPASQENPQDAYFGLATGAWYSHLGSPNSNFWGASDHSPTFDNGANMVLIPANLKVGMNFGESFRASVRGGGNVIYRSAPESARLGSGSDANVNSWALLPNAGLDLEWQVGDNVAIVARPDLTIAPGNNMFVGTLGASIHPF